MNTTYINPLTDFGFKKIFGEEASKNHLIDFLNALLPVTSRIKDLSFKNLEQLPNIDTQRKAVYDIYCQGENGESFIVELQKIKQDYFKDRALYYSTFPIQQQAGKGNWNFRLEPVYCIGVLGFVFEKDDKALNNFEVVHKIELKNQHNAVFHKTLQFIYLEVPDFHKSLEELKTRLDKWLYFLKHLEDLQSIPEILKDAVFEGAFETAKLANLSATELENYHLSLKVLWDAYAIEESAHNRGKAEGFSEGEIVGEARGREAGLLEGETKGREAGKLEVAKAMKAAGMSDVQIQAMTGLSAADLE
jgi:predicted transposase/invertase (TIGR01784 family)